MDAHGEAGVCLTYGISCVAAAKFGPDPTAAVQTGVLPKEWALPGQMQPVTTFTGVPPPLYQPTDHDLFAAKFNGINSMVCRYYLSRLTPRTCEARVANFPIRCLLWSHFVHRLLVRDATSDGFLEGHALRTTLHFHSLYLFWRLRKTCLISACPYINADDIADL
jgi:hypothetical protein